MLRRKVRGANNSCVVFRPGSHNLNVGFNQVQKTLVFFRNSTADDNQVRVEQAVQSVKVL
jgi:hypothetical protein